MLHGLCLIISTENPVLLFSVMSSVWLDKSSMSSLATYSCETSECVRIHTEVLTLHVSILYPVSSTSITAFINITTTTMVYLVCFNW